MKYYVSLLATEATMADGRPIIRGENMDITSKELEHPHNARLVAEGQLLPVTEAAEKSAKAATKQTEKEGGTS